MIYGLAIFAAVLATDLFTDVRRYYKKRKVNHARGLVLRLVGLAPAVYLLGLESIPMLGFGYLIAFNGLYNLLIGQSWEFVGTTSVLDRWQRRNKWFKWAKYVGLVVSVGVYIILHKR